MDKIYQKTTWENSPSTNTPINETNLNNIENGVDELDNRVVRLDQIKSNVDWVQLQQGGKKIAEITIDGVKKNVYAPNGSGGGGGTTDYEDLDNKPSINGVSLVGNKTNSDLGIIIPTTLAELEEDTTHRTVTDAQITKWNQGGSGGGGTAETTTYDNSKSGLIATNVQDAIDEQKQDLNKKAEFKNYNSYAEALADINNIEEGQYVSTDGLSGNKFSIVEGNFGTITDGTIFNSDSAYPSGFNKDNCVVISFMIRDSNAQWKTPATESSTTSYHRSFVILNNTNIRVCSNLSGHSNFAYKIVLMRTDI